MIGSNMVRDTGHPEVFSGLPRSHQANVRILLRLGPDRFLRNPFHFIITKLSYQLTLFSLDTDSVVK
jgi:hypothetical protein